MSDKLLSIYIGYDPRQPIALNVLQSSIYRNSSKPVSITPLVLTQLPLKREGLTPFTYSRFLVPYLCEFKGWALFLDLDMIVLGDIAELFNCADDKYSAMVVKNKMKFEWASAILFNCAKCKMLTPQFVTEHPSLHNMSWLKPDEVGELPAEWNHLVGYDEPKENPKLIHYTQGIPAFPETSDCEYSNSWVEEYKKMNSATTWVDLMGKSVHAAQLPNGTIIPKYKAKQYAA